MVKVILVLLLFTTPVVAQSGTSSPSPHLVDKNAFFKPFGNGFVVSSAVFWSGTVTDLATTRHNIATGRFRESNPFLRDEHGGVRTGRALAVSGAAYGFTLLLEKRHPKLASIVRFIGGGVHFAAVRR